MSKRILDLNTISSASNDDYLVVDGNSGTRKITPENIVGNSAVAQILEEHINDANAEIGNMQSDIGLLQSAVETIPAIDSTLTQSGQAADAKVVGDEISTKVAKPVSSPNGTLGQVLRTNGDGTTQWVNQGLPTDEQTASAITTWLNNHPEATTTVQDGSLTYAKLVNGTLNFVTPEMYGAKGDGVTDDTTAIQSAVNSGKNVLFSRATYVCGRVVIRNSNVILDGNFSTLLHGANYGFVISKDAHDVEIRNFNSICTYEKDSQQETNVHISIGADNDNPDSEYFAYNITVRNCSFYGGVVGFSATSVKNILIENCKFDGFVYKPEDTAGGYGILLQSCINVRIAFCDFSAGAYGRHDIYVSVDQRKTLYKKCKNITIDSCSFDHSGLVLIEGSDYYSPMTVAINIRASSKVTVRDSYFSSVTGAVNFLAIDGSIDAGIVKNCKINNLVYNTGSAETRNVIGFIGTTENHITAEISGIDITNVPETYTVFVSLKNCTVNVYSCNIDKTNVVCYENVLLHLWDIITTFTSYFIRFVGGDETKGFCKNITFINGTLSPSRYYFSEGSSAGVGFYDTVQIRVTLPDSVGFTDWAELPDKMNPEKCYCSGIGLLHSSGRRFGQGTNSASARIFVELGTNGYRVYNSDSQYFGTRPYIYISPIPGI